MQINKHAIIIWAYTLATLLALVFVFLGIRSCAGKGKKEQVALCKEGETRITACNSNGGRLFELCQDGKFKETFNECKQACSETVFDRDISPLITNKCVSCHTTFTDFEVAKTKADHFVTRVTATDPGQRMPKGQDALPQNEIDLFKQWKEDGVLKECPGTNKPNPHIGLNDIEDAILDDLEGLSGGEQLQARYLVTSHKSNEGADQGLLAQFSKGINKSLNSLSFVRNIVLAQAVDQYKTVYRVSLKDLNLIAADWKLVEDHEPVNIVSFTNKGKLIQDLTKTKKPWLHIDSFAFTANQPDVYYALRDLPLTEKELFLQLGVDIDQDQDDFSALFAGFIGKVSLQKNRLATRFDSNDGSLWITFDIDNRIVTDDRNLFAFPLLKNSQKIFRFDASEMIFSIQNGLHGYYLANAAGERQNAAPLTVVSDYQTQFSPEIKAGISCYRCHQSGFISFKDEIKAHVFKVADQFDLNDVDLVDALYRDPTQDLNDDNAQYIAALARMGIAASDADPVNLVSDNLRRNQTALSVASLLFLTEQEFLEGLARSAEGQEQVGTLLTGGTITFQQLVASLPVLIRDLRIGVDPINP